MFYIITVYNVTVKILGPSFYPSHGVLLWKESFSGRKNICCSDWLLMSLLMLNR